VHRDARHRAQSALPAHRAQSALPAQRAQLALPAVAFIASLPAPLFPSPSTTSRRTTTGQSSLEYLSALVR
jgi:hypothetical protein